MLITGGSRGTGLEAGRQLAEKGASIIIVARDEKKLQEGIEYLRAGARDENQRFHHISADLTSSEEAVRVIAEATTWNSGSPPDVVWCTAGISHPSLFVDTEISKFRELMDGNYFSSVYIAHATLKAWLREDTETENAITAQTIIPPTAKLNPRHLIFTASFLAFYPIAGYAPYNPSKAALRTLSDQLSQEMNLYAAARPHLPPVKVHTVFPATIFTESYENENKIKSDLTKMLEEADGGQTPAEVAKFSIRGLENGYEIITTDILTRFVSCSTLGASIRGGFWKGFADYIMGCIGLLVLVFVRWDMDYKVRQWGKRHGDTGMKTALK